MMWESIKYVSSGLTLVAFITAVVAWVYKSKSQERERLINTAKAEDRADLVRRTLEYLDINVAGLTVEQQFTIAITQIRERANRFRTTAILVGLVAILLAGIAIFALKNRSPDPKGSKVVLIDSFPRRYDRESPVTNAHEIEKFIEEIALAERREISAEHILVGSTFENADQVLGKHPDIIVIHLSCFFLSTNDSIDVSVFRAAMDEFERFLNYVLKNNKRTRFLVYTREPPKTNHWPVEILQAVTEGYNLKKAYIEANPSRMRLLILPWDAKFNRADIIAQTKSALRDELTKL